MPLKGQKHNGAMNEHPGSFSPGLLNNVGVEQLKGLAKRKGSSSHTAKETPAGGPTIASARPAADGELAQLAHQHKKAAAVAKIRATEDWVAGRMTTKQHKAVHTRANHILKGAL